MEIYKILSSWDQRTIRYPLSSKRDQRKMEICKQQNHIKIRHLPAIKLRYASEINMRHLPAVDGKLGVRVGVATFVGVKVGVSNALQWALQTFGSIDKYCYGR